MAKKSPSDTPKLSVFTDKALLKRLRREKVETEMTIGDIVNARLKLSYDLQPRLEQPAVSA